MSADRVRVVDDRLRDVPADGETMGEIVMRGTGKVRKCELRERRQRSS